jgi:hypothetical protein
VRNLFAANTQRLTASVTLSNLTVTGGVGPNGEDMLVTYNGTGVTTFCRFSNPNAVAVGTVSVTVKADGARYMALGSSNTGSENALFDLQDGVVTTSPTVGGATASIVSLGDGWYRCILGGRIFAGSVFFIWPSTSAVNPAGNSTLTTGDGVAGILLRNRQVELGSVATAEQVVGATNHDITEEGVEPISQVDFDLLDDTHVSPAIAAGLTGQAFVAGDGGMFVSDLTIAAAGTFTIGTASDNWTGATPGILRAVAGPQGRVLDWGIREGSFPEAEIEQLETFYIDRGGKGLLESNGTELLTIASMTGGTGWVFGAGIWTKTAGTASLLTQAVAFVPDGIYSLSVAATRTAGTLTPRFTGGTTVDALGITATETALRFVVAVTGNTTFELSADALFAGTVTAVSLQRFQPREEL